ncbi:MULTISPECIES: hypothetical protein [unclassified Tolypothrix]|uniref:hypothetical protein n=1 Tax=unclassified Tolypothrix TaxID=2649714 RepID=UPI0012D7CE9D|nr:MULTISPECIES: hypothetical protein [unclassified Tolypothrix]MBE9081040.1 hypothetical protein [Tolypothrix sp. LEGE 11397]UYD24894.1 hypothetical protein HGR01_26270 [Tolypothrix sp. PCC 7712]UYD32873.1 hypothetical protein HG267_28365 [Tolypothrix sp. PCC 7601]
MTKTNFPLSIWLKQQRRVFGGMLLAIAITGCSNSGTSQLSSVNSPSVANISDTSSPTSSPVSPTPNTADSQLEQEAVQVIRDYYSAIARHDYKQAYSTWSGDGAASQQSFEQFQQGFANTASVAVEVGEPGRVEGAAGSLYINIPVTVTAVTADGTPQRFRGNYVLRRVNNVPGSTPEQRLWHIDSAKITKAN